MRNRKSVALGFGSIFALALALGGLATASGQSASLSGTVQSGPNGLIPISGARVTLFAAGTAYGADSAGLGAAITDSHGNFTVEYTPPATPTVLYLLAHGGNAGAGTNAALGLVGVAGMSNALPASVTINELTTVAAEWALAQFFGSTGRVIGAPASNATGFANAVNQLQANLVDIATGAPASFWSSYGVTEASCTVASPPVNCDGLERLDTFASILAACVETSGPPSSTCKTLLFNTAATDTLQAAHVMATNPVSHVTTLFNLQSSSSPFTPRLLHAPDGWEIALNFAPSGANFNNPFLLVIDAAGNPWVTNSSGNSLTELTSSGALAGNFAPSGANFNFPAGVAIAAAGNPWVTNCAFYCSLSGTNGSVTELTSSGGLAGNFAPAGANFEGPVGVAIDAAGDVWVVNYFGDSVTGLTSSGGLAGNFAPSGANFYSPEDLAIDATGNVWLTNYDNNSVSELQAGCSSSSCTGLNFAPAGANFNGPIPLAIDAAGDVWVANYYGNTATELTSSGGLAGNFDPSGANFNAPRGLAIDASGNVWMTNYYGNTVTELIAAARPVLTPLVACLKRTPSHAVCLP